MSRSVNPLYVMVKPPPELAAVIGAIPRVAANRPPHLLHLTLLPLGDRADTAEAVFALIRGVLDAIAMSPFRLVFDRVRDSGRTVSLRPSEPLRGAVTFQRALAAAFDRHGLRIAPRYVFRPHVTLSYRGRTPDERAIDPISWRVEDIRLVESVVGETRHVEHGRWTLHRDAACPAAP